MALSHVTRQEPLRDAVLERDCVSIRAAAEPSRRRPASRRGWRVGVAILVACVGLSGGAFLVGQRFRTPAEIAADARPPAPSLLTAPVEYTQAHASIVIRANAAEVGLVPLAAPPTLDGDLAVVTALNVHPGTLLTDGSVPLAVAQRPLIVMPGAIPAFRVMGYGDSGVDISELQAALEQLGYSVGSDDRGVYGLGTATAVAEFYRAIGYVPQTMPITQKVSTKRTRIVHLADVPLGEVAFIASLPRRVVSVHAALGSVLGAPSGNSPPVLELGSGRVAFNATVDANTQGLLRDGDVGRAASDISGRSVGVKVISISSPTASNTPAATGDGPLANVLLVPRGPGADALAGQNVAIRLEVGSGAGSHWVVPVGAVSTDASGVSFVIVLHHGIEHRISVRPGLATGSSEIIQPLTGRLHPGDPVVIGSAVP